MQAGSGEVTLGGLADGGLALSALYDTGVLERLRLDVRVRLIADLTHSLAWLHANPRLMAAHRHLLIAPSTVVIGLDGVARVDVRAAKKRAGDQNEMELAYAAPEVESGSETADHRADIFSLGILTWEALAGRRLCDAIESATKAERRRGAIAEAAEELDGVPPALGAGAHRPPQSPTRRTAPQPPLKGSHSRLRSPPALTLPAGGEWALPFAQMALAAMNQDVTLRPQDCRAWLGQFDALDPSLLASHQEIAEVVQGITSVGTLCVPEPTLPSPSSSCHGANGAAAPVVATEACLTAVSQCVAGAVAEPQPVPVVVAEPAVAASAPREMPPAQLLGAKGKQAAYSARAWFLAALLWLAVFGSLAGYVASILAR